MALTKQSKVVDVDKGILLVRYATADDTRRPPKVKIVVNPKHSKNVELVLNPDHKDAVLWQPGSCLVVRATRPGQLFVEVIPIDVGGSTAATVKIETLSQGEVIEVPRRPRVVRADVGAGFQGFSLLGHVAGIGDVVTRADEWIGGPSSPARIEGISIDWPAKPDDLEIRYSVRLARPHTVSDRVMEIGDYAGTRGRALPIVGVRLELCGSGASDFQLFSEALFLGAPVVRMTGKEVEFSGPTGREPLVGFRLRLDEMNVPLQPVLGPSRVTKAKSSGRVRVFRSQAVQKQLRSTLQSFFDAPRERPVAG